MQDLLLKRYSNIEYVNNLPYKKGFELYVKACKEDEREKLFEIWLVNFSRMDKDNFISFEDYIKDLEQKAEVQKRIDSKSSDEILSMVDDIRKRAGKKKAGEQ